MPSKTIARRLKPCPTNTAAMQNSSLRFCIAIGRANRCACRRLWPGGRAKFWTRSKNDRSQVLTVQRSQQRATSSEPLPRVPLTQGCVAFCNTSVAFCYSRSTGTWGAVNYLHPLRHHSNVWNDGLSPPLLPHPPACLPSCRILPLRLSPFRLLCWPVLYFRLGWLLIFWNFGRIGCRAA